MILNLINMVCIILAHVGLLTQTTYVCSIWGFYSNFTNYDFRQTLDCKDKPLPEWRHSRVFLEIKGFLQLQLVKL